jgi:pyruvate carboxylase
MSSVTDGPSHERTSLHVHPHPQLPPARLRRTLRPGARFRLPHLIERCTARRAAPSAPGSARCLRRSGAWRLVQRRDSAWNARGHVRRARGPAARVHACPSARFRKVLIANRGEIAVRIIRTSGSWGSRRVARLQRRRSLGPGHVRAADEAARAHPDRAGRAQPRRATSASTDRSTSRRRRGRRRHPPGVRLSSRRTAPCPSAASRGHHLHRPPASAMDGHGLEDRGARKNGRRGRAHHPRRQRCHGGRSPRDRERVGYPVLLKASAGGGGKGMRLVDKRRGARRRSGSARAARRSAASATPPSTSRRRSSARGTSRSRCWAIAHGNMVHLFERDCSIQRRTRRSSRRRPAPPPRPS